ncbi:MAG: radical SAM protein [Deltaproteobacteria bacterium]
MINVHKKTGASGRVDIKVTFQCNNSCLFCVQGRKRRTAAEKTREEIEDILRASRSGCAEAVFTGGEPTLRPDILALLRYAAHLGYRTQIQSNGRLFCYRDFCVRMAQAGMNAVVISLHGPGPRVHDRLTRAEGSFRQTAAGIKNLRALGIEVMTNTVINKFNYRLLPDIARRLVELNVSHFQFAFPHILGEAKARVGQLIPTKTEVIPHLLKALEIGDREKRTVRIEAIPYCFLPGREACVSDRYIPDTRVFDVHAVKDFDRWRKRAGKCKGPRCPACRYNDLCEGPWREYPKIFGWKEFRPVARDAGAGDPQKNRER